MPAPTARDIADADSVAAMEENSVRDARNVWRLAVAILAVVAIIIELRKPESERTWHGKIAGFVPYDFRMPTIGRIRETYWSPDGPLITGKVFGVGWAPNLGAFARFLNRSDPAEATE